MVFSSIAKIFTGGSGERKAGRIADSYGQGMQKLGKDTADLYRQYGTDAIEQMQPFVEGTEQSYDMLGDMFLRGDMSGFTNSPQYQYLQDEAMKAVERSASARGGVVSGRTMKELQRNAANIASGDYQNFLGGLFKYYGAGEPYMAESINMPFRSTGLAFDAEMQGLGAGAQGAIAKATGDGIRRGNIYGGLAGLGGDMATAKFGGSSGFLGNLFG